ncbi:MAG: TetR/AcrR family transcriptional regulator, partial [Myxococcota bacterium]
IEYFADHLESTKFLMGCPIATVALEAAATSDELQKVCSKHYAEWQGLIAAYLGGHGLDAEEASDVATTVLATFEGGLLLSRAHRDVTPLRAAGRQLSRLVDMACAPGS